MRIVLLTHGANHMHLYLRCIHRAGANPLVVETAGDIPSEYHALLLPGGGDPAPAIGNYKNPTGLRGVDQERDALEELLFYDAFLRGVPILGICRGAQMINCLQGGSLFADIERDMGIGEQHENGAAHEIEITPLSLLQSVLDTTMVNSYHHQCVDRLGVGLVESARSPAGVVEAIEHKNRRILGVQWHPERMNFNPHLWRWLVS